MSDNVELNAASGGATISTDDAGVSGHIQRVKLTYSADGDATHIGADGNGLDVDVTRVIPGTAATALGKAEDAAHSTGDVGVMALTVRQDTAAALSGTDADYQPLITDGSGRLHVNVGTSALPSGAATSARQDTLITALQACQTALELIDDIINTDDTSTHATGTSKGALFMAAAAPTDASVNANDIGAVAMTTDRKLHVSVQDALPAGTNAIGKLAANSGVDIGDVDVTSVVPGTGATNLGKAEDAAHSSGDTGVMLLAVREATATDLSAGGTDGDYEPLQVDANGKLHVNPGTVTVASHNVTNAGTFAVQATVAAGATNIAKAEDVASADADVGVPAMAIRKATPANTSDTDGDYEMLQMSAGRLWVDASGVTLTVGSHAVTNATLEGAIKAEDAAHSSGDSGIMALGVRAASPTERSAGPTDGDYEPLGINEVGAVWSSLAPSANGGCSTFMASGSDGSTILVATAQAIKASAGVLYGYYAYNPEAAVTFVHFYNTAQASVTVGTTNPLFTIPIPAGSAANLWMPHGVTFSNAGWSCSATTTAGGNTAPSTGVSLVAWYK